MNNIYISFIIILCFYTGCSPNVSVHGTVAFPDGKPLTKGMVCFKNDKIIVRGDIRLDGTYKLGMEKSGNGILPGHYNIFISGAVEIEDIPIPKGKEIPRIPNENPLINPRFFSEQTSGLNCNVEKGMKLPYNITVEYP
jgi:hypothetical protein